MKGIISLFIIIALLMFVTNPDFGKHANAIDNQYDTDNPISGIIIGPNVIKRVVKYKNNYLYSITTYDGVIVSVGAFGNVKVKNLDIKF